MYKSPYQIITEFLEYKVSEIKRYIKRLVTYKFIDPFYDFKIFSEKTTGLFKLSSQMLLPGVKPYTFKNSVRYLFYKLTEKKFWKEVLDTVVFVLVAIILIRFFIGEIRWIILCMRATGFL